MRKILILIAFAASTASAGIVSTEQPTVYRILLADNTIEKGKEWPKSEAECLTRAQALLPAGTCSIQRKFLNVGDCKDVAKKVWPLEKDADGFVLRPKFKDDGFKPGSTTEYQFLVEDFVPAPFPDCWTPGWRIAEDFEINAPYPDDPMLANTIEPMATPVNFEEERRRPADVAARQDNCVCYADDPTPCPEKCTDPKRLVGACGDFRSVECGGPGIIPGVNDNKTLGIP